MLSEGDRLTELMVQKERLEFELTQEGLDEERRLEIEGELDDIWVESESITQTLDTLEEHLSYVSAKVEKLEEEVGQFDMD